MMVEISLTTLVALPSDTLIYGNKGMGKSTKIKEMAEWHFKQGHVCFDMFDSGRLEDAFYHLQDKP